MASCNRQHQSGFSLLEMMTTVTLAGALSATTIAYLEDAREQAAMLGLDAMAHSLEQAAYQAWSRAVLDGVHRQPEASIELQNQTVRLVQGYPSADHSGIAAALRLPALQWRLQVHDGSMKMFSSAHSHDCHLVYRQADRAGDVPVIEKAGNGCHQGPSE